MWYMEHVEGADLGTYAGKPRTLPGNAYDNKQCSLHAPVLTDFRILGAEVAVEAAGDGSIVTGTVVEAAEGADAPVGRTARGTRFWRVKGKCAEDGTPAQAIVAESDIRAATRLRRCVDAYSADERRQRVDDLQKKVDALQHQVKRLQPKPPAAPPPHRPSPRRPAAAAPDDAAAAAAAPPSPRQQQTTAQAAATAETARVRPRVPIPDTWTPGTSITVDVPRDYVPRSEAMRVDVQPPADAPPGGFARVDVTLPLRPSPPPKVTIEKQGKTAAHLRMYIARRAVAARLEYSPTPNPYNPRRAWPLREPLTFANLRPEYFELPENARVFKKLFGFKTWDLAMVVFERVERWDPATGGPARSAVRPDRALLAPRFQYLAALWRMRQRKDLDELARFFGVLTPRMSQWVARWIRKLGAYAKANLIFAPRDYESLIRLLPASFKECGLGSVVLIGDASDILCEDDRGTNIARAKQEHSDKTKHAAGMGLAWVSPNGLIVIATDLLLGRTSEHAACLACKPQLDRIPAKYALMYDKGVSKLRVHLLNLNQVIVPCFLRDIKRFSIEQAIRNRGVTCCRYVVEVPFSGVKSWQFLTGVVPFEDKYLLNEVWWWAVGFHNLTTAPLKPPAGL